MKTLSHALLMLLVIWATELFAQSPPSGAPPTTVQAKVTLAVDATGTLGVIARAHVEFLDYYAVRGQAAPWRDSAGRFILDATVEPVAVIAIYPPPPKPVVDLKYSLGNLPVGNYTVVFRMNGVVFGEKTFTVPSAPPLVPPVEVTLQVATTNTGSVAKAKVVFPDGYWNLTDPGVAMRNGSQIAIDAKANPINTLVPPTGPAVFEPQYPLGLLPAGAYSVIYRINGTVIKVLSFTVAPLAGPQLTFINFRQGDVSMVAEVGVTVPPGSNVSDWGEVVRDGSQFKVALTIGPADGSDPAPTSSSGLLRHTYSLGLVEPGDYRMTVSDATNGGVLGTRGFTVGSPLPPPLPPPPLVAYLQPGQDSAGWFMELGLAFPRPGLVVKDWGTPVRNGARIGVTIQVGSVAVPVLPYDPVAGGVPVFCGPLPPVDEPPSVVAPAQSAPFNEICGWPTRLVRHRYGLGSLEPGEYGFMVKLGDREVAKCSFIVPDQITPGPLATLVAPPLETATAEPYAFQIIFNAAAGWEGEPGQWPVTVTGPNGFSGVAKLVSSIPSLDPLGRLFSCSYALTGPGGAWDAADTGDYRVCVDPAVVVDRNGRPLPRPSIGQFAVRIRPNLPPPPPELQATVAVEMRDGRWFANVAFENTGGWFACDWGSVQVHGNVFATMAKLRPLPPGSMAPIPASFTHAFPLESPPPGAYAFVFKSDVGHGVEARFEVPGVPPAAPLEAWAITTGTREGAGLDDDGDGWTNLAEFSLGMQPQTPDQPNFQPKVVVREGRRHFAMEFRRLHGVEALSIGVEVSQDLQTWIDGSELVDWTPAEPDLDGTQAVEVVQKQALDVTAWPFMRLRVNEPSAP